MDNISDSRRPRAAPDPVPATEDHVLPRGKLVVEVYVAEQRAAEPTLSVHRRERHGVSSRTLAMVAVLGLHASIGIWLWASMNTLQLPHRSPLESLVLLDPIAAPETHSDPAMPLPSPDLVPAPPQPAVPKLTSLVQGSSEIAVTITASTDVLISNANEIEVGAIFAGCSANKIQSMPAFDRAAEVTLLVRVEKAGRVTDSKIEVGSGVQRVDEAAQRCILAHGLLTPRRVNGEPVPSWQRVRWPAGQTEARLL